ncbi:MAG: 50S ribosomal protein L23 [Puniceicoccales bacterium]|jgi:ribosomal protein L23|nr:50S ribosomal protein L23 [Puniceicoccales bacterium]
MMMNLPGRVLKGFVFTEKANKLIGDRNQYTFRVDRSATSGDVARAIRLEFGFKPLRVNVLNVNGKRKKVRLSKLKPAVPIRKPSFKKAVVHLRADEKIEIL